MTSAASPLAPTGRIDALDSIRGLAALVVVFDHCVMSIPRYGNPALHHGAPQATLTDPLGLIQFCSPLRVLWSGTGAVALFFVLSGFVLSLPWLRGQPPLYGSFVVKRVCRIYIPYVVAVGLAALLASVLSAYLPTNRSQWFATTNWTEPETIAVAVDQALMLGRHIDADNVIWSLVYEMRISLLLPLLMWPILAAGRGGAAALAAALAVTSWSLTRFLPASELVQQTAAMLQYAVLFVAGAVLARELGRIRSILARRPTWIVLALLCGGLLILGVDWPHFPYYCFGLGSAMVIAAALAPGRVAQFLERPGPRFIGRISYSLYLVHLPLLLTMAALLRGVLAFNVMLLFVPAASIVVAAVFHRLVEAPSIALGRRLATRPVASVLPRLRDRPT
jgi:peptidoglycan/LPS O-acetylase OafA/YrhL